MESAKKKQKLSLFYTLSIVIVVVAGILALGAYAVHQKYIKKYDKATAEASTLTIRELILEAAEQTKTNAPVDPKTGDIYFPQAKLYLPNTDSRLRLTYQFDPADSSAGNDTDLLLVSNQEVMSQAAVKLRTATTIEDIFAAVPKLQACHRGVRLQYIQKSDDETSYKLADTITLNNGKVLFVYTEKGCPELDETVTLLAELKAY